MTATSSVAIVGINGFIGKHVVNALVSPQFKSKITFPVHIVTSDEEKVKSSIEAVSKHPENFKFFKADLATGEGLNEAFKGVDVVVNLVGLRVTHQHIADAAKASNVKVYVPSEFGVHITESSLGPYTPVFKFKVDARDYARELGLKTVLVATGLFYEFVFKIPGVGGFISDTQLQIYEPDSQFGATSLADIGRTVAWIVSQADSPENIPDYVSVKGATLTRQKVADLYEAATGKKLDVEKLPASTIVDAAEKVVAEGVKSQQDFGTILVAVFSQGYGDFKESNNASVEQGGAKFETIEEASKRLLQ